MELPIVKGLEQKYLDKRMCPVCKNKGVHEPNSFAFLSAGALSEKGGSKNLLGFFDIGWHGAHLDMGGVGVYPDKGGHVKIAEDAVGGQFELYFCSTECLRKFLNHCVDELEEKIQKKK
jgi:hypothetical protein